MDIFLYNSLSKKREQFVPLRPNTVTMYVCGPTVYNYVHIGNMRPVVVFDVLRRLFLSLDYKVTFISNFTDIDDKVIEQAKKENLTEAQIADKYIKVFEEAREKIGSLKPTFQPRVTETMEKIVTFIAELVEKGFAYVIDGDVYFRVSKIDDYGCLSNRKLDEMLAGARVDENDKKENPFDFTLWKATVDGIRFPSPWSEGRPGWHSECVVMIESLIPEGKIDIHGGGFDLKFPHHENEIAQCEALHHHKIATYWMHNGFINVDDVKMSKSLGNVALANETIDRYGGNVVRYVLLNAQYRSPVNVSDTLYETAKKETEKFFSAFQKASIALQRFGIDVSVALEKEALDMQAFFESLCDDLNTANAFTEVGRVTKDIHVLLRQKDFDVQTLLQKMKTLEWMFWILGFQKDQRILSKEECELFDAYDRAKQEKDFVTSDRIRDVLIEKNLF